MDIIRFYAELAKRCKADGCRGCGAREFCYTAPASMTEEIIRRAVDWISGSCETEMHARTANPTHSGFCRD